MSKTKWNRTPRTPAPWRVRASELGIDREVALLCARFIGKASVESRALCHAGIIDLLYKHRN